MTGRGRDGWEAAESRFETVGRPAGVYAGTGSEGLLGGSGQKENGTGV